MTYLLNFIFILFLLNRCVGQCAVNNGTAASSDSGRSDEDHVDTGTAKAHARHRIIREVSTEKSNSTDFRPKYHLAPVKGWMNDPNGLCLFNGVYHLFYQHNPYSSYEPGIAHWAHAISKDLVKWKHLPVAMYPDKWYDKQGVFSGSCIIIDNVMHLYYTGNVNPTGSDQKEYQALATSKDGVTVTKYDANPIINGSDFQPNIRDPKVWKHGDKYYMVIGNSFVSSSGETLGRILLWISEDAINWKMASILLESDGKLGYMFECPDLFELDGYFVLMFSPQGVKPEGDKYRNLYQTGYVIGNFDYETNIFTPLSEFKELDHGHDLYATQSNLDENGNRFVIAWMDMWDQNYPEMQQGFTGQMTLPRVLSVTKTGDIIQKIHTNISKARGRTIYSGKLTSSKIIELKNNSAEIIIKSSTDCNFEVFLKSVSSEIKISYDHAKGYVVLDRGGEDGVRRTNWRPKSKLLWKLYVDSSSVELFCGEGEVVFSSRIFPSGPLSLQLGKGNVALMRISSMKKTVTLPKDTQDITYGIEDLKNKLT